jgi:hypothetical protein
MEKWFRIVLFATAAMNIGGSLSFIPANRAGREMFGLPEPHPVYLWILACWIFAFGVCYLWMAIKQKREWLFIAIGATGKLSFAALLAIYWLVGEFSFRTALAGAGDWIFGCLFVWWLIKNNNDN